MVKRLLPTFATMMLLTGAAGAVDLGEAALQSGSGQALDAIIRLDDVEGLNADQIEIRIASSEDFARFALDRDPVLDRLQLTLDLDGGQDAAGDSSIDGPILRLTSSIAIEQPFLSLLLDTRWPSGRVLTEYTLRLQAAAFSAQSVPTRIEPTRSEAVALTDEATAEPASATLPVGTPQTAGQISPEQTTGAQVVATDTGLLDNASTITVGEGDTLWVIAQRVRPDSSVSVQQTMLALQRLNPEAFIGNNINQVLRGAVLRVPELADIRQLGSAQAMAEVARQNQLLMLPPAQSLAATSGNEASAQGELRIVAVEDNEDQQPDASAAGSQAAERERRLNELEDRLAVRQEELDRLERSNEELNARLSMLQQQVTASQEIIRLRDLELAQLQQSLTEQANERPTPPPPPVVTMAPEGSPMERIANTLMNNTWALLGIILALIVLVVLVLAARNRAARAKEQAAQQPAQDSDELLFADVAKAGIGADRDAVAGLATGDADDAGEADDVVTELEADWENEGGQPEPIDDTAAATAAATAVLYDDSSSPDSLEREDSLERGDSLERDDSLQFEENLDPDDDVGFNQENEAQRLRGGPVDTEAGAPPAEPDAPATTEELIEALDAASVPKQPLDPDEEFSLDTSFELDETLTKDSGEPREQGRGSELDTEFDWPSQELQDAGIEVPPAVDETATASADVEGYEFDDLAFASLADDDEDDDGDEGLGFGSDEAATKLDLARAYIDMGDEPGAREILEEVLQEGTEEQRDDARKLLQRL